MPLSDEYLAKFHKENDPRQLVSRFVSLPYKKLGRDTIEGIEAEAIEVNHPDIAAGMLANAIGRLWVDIENHLPVRMTLEGSAAKKTVRMVMTAREFRWNAELEPSLFEPNIPADFTQAGKVETAQSDEQKAVLSLKLFAQITDGQYPHDLALLSTMQQAGEALSQKDKDLSIAERQKILLSISHVCQFYSQLQDQNIDFGYFGHKIKAEDSDSLLMYWQKSPEQYKVILADLTMKILTPNELANLKIKSEKYTTRKK
jgi:hypothetical protein